MAMLPRLTAQESMLAAERLAVGTGAATRAQARTITTAWHRSAGLGGGRTKTPPTAGWGAIGIGMRKAGPA